MLRIRYYSYIAERDDARAAPLPRFRHDNAPASSARQCAAPPSPTPNAARRASRPPPTPASPARHACLSLFDTIIFCRPCHADAYYATRGAAVKEGDAKAEACEADMIDSARRIFCACAQACRVAAAALIRGAKSLPPMPTHRFHTAHIRRLPSHPIAAFQRPFIHPNNRRRTDHHADAAHLAAFCVFS